LTKLRARRLRPDDERLPAIKVYLDLGFKLELYQEGMAARWGQVRTALIQPR
jgi:hypothetical protein